MTPLIDGELHYFESRGLYDGVSILWDRETGTFWHHITGDALSGPLLGKSMKVFNLLHTTVRGALDTHPEIEVAISDRPIRGRIDMSQIEGAARVLSDRFLATIAAEDERLPTMEIGLGVWNDDVRKFYPMKSVRSAGNALVDAFGDRTLIVYIDPDTYSLLGMYADVTTAEWADGALLMSDRSRLEGGRLIGTAGEETEIVRPLQVFTRWYGFSLTFPETEIYEP